MSENFGVKQRQRLVGVHVNHGAALEWAIKPGADWTVHVLSRGREVVRFLVDANDDAHEDHVVGLLKDDLAGVLAVPEAERHAKLEFTDVSLAEGKGVT